VRRKQNFEIEFKKNFLILFSIGRLNQCDSIFDLSSFYIDNDQLHKFIK